MEIQAQTKAPSSRRLSHTMLLFVSIALFFFPAPLGKPFTFELFDSSEYFLLLIVPALAAFALLLLAKNKLSDLEKFRGYCWAVFLASIVLLAIPLFISLFYWMDEESKKLGLMGMAEFFFSILVVGGWLFAIPLFIVSLALSVIGIIRYPTHNGNTLPILAVATQSMVLGLAYWFLAIIFE